MKGMYVISQRDIIEDPQKDDPIAISSFPIDSHDVQRIALKDGGVINEGTIFSGTRKKGRGSVMLIMCRTVQFCLSVSNVINLLVPVALSCTHVGISSLRIEGAWMVIGQGAGVVAALAVKDDVLVQDLEYKKIRHRLLAQKQVLDLPEPSTEPNDITDHSSINPKSLGGILLDDADATLTGHWAGSKNFKPYVGSGYIHDGARADGKSIAAFKFTAPEDRSLRDSNGLLGTFDPCQRSAH